jgi:cytosine/adenosine deaminase-related metal-dependent hydrolase
MTNVEFYDLKAEILQKIKKKGGFVNTHAHLDRAFTITKENYKLMNKLRGEKWKLNKNLRINSSSDEIYARMAKAVELLLSQGVQATASFIDVDPDIKDKSIKAAEKIKEKYGKDIKLKFLNQSSYGILESDSYEWFLKGSEYCDIIGGLLKADNDRKEEHLDRLFSRAVELGKMVHIHVDEENTPEEKETELVCKKIIEHGLEGRVVGIHGISINCHPKKYREKIYKLINEAQLMFIACPMSWLNSRRSEVMTPTHNPVTPVDEMIPAGITVAFGLDNIHDIFMAYNDGNMWNDLRVLMEANRFYDVEKLVDIATTNGLKVLGLNL